MGRPFKETYAEVSIASPLKRLGALLYDLMIVVALWMVTGFIAVTINNGEAVTGPQFQSFLFILTYLFLAFFWTRSGQTLGMLAWRLRVQTTEGQRISFMQSLIRFLVGSLSLGFCGAGFLWMFINKQKLAWHDLASGCHVIQLPKHAKALK